MVGGARACALSIALLAITSCQQPRHQSSTSPPPPRAEKSTSPPLLKVKNLDKILAPIQKSGELPALAGAVFKGDHAIAEGAVGVRKLGDSTEVARDDRWHLGSDTKAMTATLVALLVGEGKVHWDTTLAQAFPEDAKSFNPAWKSVTIEMLLAHRGGAPGDVPDDIWNVMWETGEPQAQRRVAVMAMLKRAPVNTPGTTYVYANAGYMMVGAAIEEIMKDSWSEMLKARIFTPLGMKSCGFGAPATVGKVDEPWGHSMKGKTLTPVDPGPGGDNPPSLGPAGTVHCDLDDWGKFLVEHIHPKVLALSDQALTKLHTPVGGDGYALGWIVEDRDWAKGVVYTHLGSNLSFAAVAWVAPGIDRVFVAATNRGDDQAYNALDDAIWAMVQADAKKQ